MTRHSLKRHVPAGVRIYGLVLEDLKRAGLYRRPMEWRKSAADKPIMWDILSDAPMSTEHACARFLVPHLAGSGLAVFMDGDMLVRKQLQSLLEGIDLRKAVSVVQHDFRPPEGTKMDGQVQLPYARKNWSSLVVFNCDHPSNKKLTLDMVNALPGRDLHRFCWLSDSEIGSLDPEYNWLVGHSNKNINPAIVHFTEGLPDMHGYADVDYADEWRAELEDFAR